MSAEARSEPSPSGLSDQHQARQPSPEVSFGLSSDTDASLNMSAEPSMSSPMSAHPVLSSTPSSSDSSATVPSVSVAASAKKSTLNPNAKEFVLNPNAKVFVPGAASGVGISPGRPPISGTPPQRPMTPATPNLQLGYGASPMPPHLLGPAGPGPLQHPHHPHYIHYVQSPGPMFSPAGGPQVSPYPGFQPNAMAVSQAQMHPQQQQQLQQQQQQSMAAQQRYRTTSTSNSGPGGRQVNPAEVQSPNHILAATGQPILAQINAGSPSQPPSYMQLPPQAHPQFAASMAAMMQANHAMLMRHQPGAMGPVMVSQPPGGGPIPITSVSGMMDPSGAGGHPTMAGPWMQQHGGQAPPAHMPGVPPPNSLAGPHLAQPPPQGIQGGGGPQHNPAVANSAQVN